MRRTGEQTPAQEIHDHGKLVEEILVFGHMLVLSNLTCVHVCVPFVWKGTCVWNRRVHLCLHAGCS